MDSGLLRWIGVVSIGLLFLVLLIQNPVTIYVGNPNEVVISLVAALLVLIPLSACFILIGLAPLFLLCGTGLHAYSFAALASSLGVWIYSNFVRLDVGVLDGQRLNLDFGWTTYLLEGVTLLLGVLVLYWAFRRWPKVLRDFVFLLGAVVLLSSLASVVTTPFSFGTLDSSDRAPIYRFSPDKNLLIVLMDTFQSDVFAELVKADAALETRFDGFTFFPDNLGSAPTTYLTMPSLHSGADYDSGTMLKDFYEQNVERGSFLNALSDAGHEVVLVGPRTFGCPEKTDLCLEVEEVLKSRASVTLHEVAGLVDLSLFRAVPFVFKSFVYRNGAWWLRSIQERSNHFVVLSNRLLGEFSERASVKSSRPTTKFLHLMNTHPPFVMDDDCGYRSYGRIDSRAAMSVQARCAVDEFTDTLEQLKRIGVYDQTAIMLIADTGSGARNLGSTYMGSDGRPSYAGAGLVGGANPILLVKPLGARGKLKTSDARVQVRDIAATVCEMLGDCEGFPGTSVFADSAERRARRVYSYFVWKNTYLGLDYIPGLVQYPVEGPLWELASWPEAARPLLRLGQPFDFAKTSQSAVYREQGWGGMVDHGTWTDGPEAVVSFERREIRGALDLWIRAQARVGAIHPQQQVEVYANDHLLGEWTLTNWQAPEERTFRIPSGVVASADRLVIKFRMLSPFKTVDEDEHRISRQRELGLRLDQLRFDPVS